jgi:putative chitinase
MIDRKKFFDAIRFNPFPGKLNVGQVKGITAILDEWERRKLTDLRWLAYILATVKHETAHTMQPIREYGSVVYLKSKKYWPWIGRGYIQLTHDYNYKAYQAEVLKIFGVDIVKNPDAALRPDVAAYILFDGMLKGRFNKKKKGLDFYFTATKTDYVHARETVNVLDAAEKIAGIAKHFYADLVEATKGAEV